MDPPHQNPNSLKHRFAIGFLRALTRIRKHGQPKSRSNSPREIAKRRRRVKIAADAAMALAVGSSRVWSQAVLRRIRNSKRRRFAGFFKRIGNCNRVKANMKKGRKERMRKGKLEFGFVNIGQERKLRKVVPGGESMDICSLLDETAHYIRCLTTQVKVMKGIAQISSTT